MPTPVVLYGEAPRPRQGEVRGRHKSCWESCKTCCGRGGCCRQAPAKFVLQEENGKILRVNLLVSVRGCCSNDSAGLDDEPPEIIFERGLEQLEFMSWMEKLHRISSLRPTVCSDVCTCFSLALFPCFWPRCFKRSGDKVRKWNAALLQWQRDFNHEVLGPLGMFCKTQSRCDVTYDKNGKHRYIERWIAFAVTPEEIAMLQDEPHLIGDVETGCCGCANEHELCIHP